MITIPDIMAAVVRGVRTKDERDMLREQINELEAALFHSDPKIFDDILTARLPKNTTDAMREIFARPEFKGNTQALRNFFQNLRDTLDTFSLLKINIAFKPSEQMIDRLHEWTQQNLGLGVALDINYDGSILGGARIIFGGKYKEMTLAQMITDALGKEKIAVLGMIK